MKIIPSRGPSTPGLPCPTVPSLPGLSCSHPIHKPPVKGPQPRMGGIEEAHEHPGKAIYYSHEAFQLRPGPQPLSALPALAFLPPITSTQALV